MDSFNGMPDRQNMEKAKKCSIDAKCDCPAFTEGLMPAERKFLEADRNASSIDYSRERAVG